MKRLIYLIFIVLLSSQLTALEECKSITGRGEIPCTVTIPYILTSPCSTYSASVFYENGTFLYSSGLQSQGDTQFCFLEFNATTNAAYIINATTGDYANIHVEGERQMTSLAVAGFLIILDLVLLAAPLLVKFSKNENINQIGRKVVWIFALGMIYFTVVVLAQLAEDAGLTVTNDILFLLDVLNVIFLIALGAIIYTMIRTSLILKRAETRKREMGEGVED